MSELTKQILVGGVSVGGGAPVTVQSMTNTPTADVKATVEQIARLEDAGCEIVRVAVPNQEAAAAIGEIKKKIHIPLVADIHFDYRLAVEAVKSGVDKVRINPGNIGSREGVKQVCDACRERGVPIRIGVNGGSLEKELLAQYGVTGEALAVSALRQAAMLNEFDFDDICISVKSSSVPLTVEAYHRVTEKCRYPLHLGVTEAGGEKTGLLRSGAGLGALLLAGIGDTIRISLTADPVREVEAGKELLRSLELRHGGVHLISCPSCGRCGIDLIAVAGDVENRLKDIRADITVAVMGCAVNGPGEARHADFGLAGGKGEGILFRHGETVGKAPMSELAAALEKLIRNEIGE